MSESFATPPDALAPDAITPDAAAHDATSASSDSASSDSASSAPPITAPVPASRPSSEEFPTDAGVVRARAGGSGASQVGDGYEGPTWEDDETRATVFLRALITLVSVGLLAWAQWRFPFDPIGAHWGLWVANSVVLNLVLPLGIVWMLFGQGLTPVPWLRDARHNAWNFGWDWSRLGAHLKISLVLWALMLPLLWWFSRDPGARADYALYLPPTQGAAAWAFLLGSTMLYMLCWEWFFRGFALFGMAQGFGALPAIGFQAVIFGLAHAGKPPLEMASSFAGGAILGVLCWREKSFVPAFLTHALVHLTWILLVLQ